MHCVLNLVGVLQPVDAECLVQGRNVDRGGRLEAGSIFLPHTDTLIHRELVLLHS